MSGDDITNKIALVNIDVPDSVDNALTNVSDGPTKQIGQTLSDCLYLVFSGVNQMASKRKLKLAYELELFEDDLKKKVESIPDEKRIEPDVQKVCPALENAKYCVESEELRNLFSNLIASSMNADTAEFAHPSFGEILKQMSPLDAKVFKIIMDTKYNPIMHVKTMVETGGFNYLCKYLSLIDISSHELISNSIENLCRLNLIEIPFDSYYTNEIFYESIRSTDTYSILVSVPKLEHSLNIEEEKKIIDKTSLGLSFSKVCLGI